MPPPPAEGFAARLVLGPALRAQPDRRLVRLVREGYEAAFEEIVRRYGKPLARYASAIAGSHAEDVTQDAFSKALLALRRDGAEIDLRPWLFRIVRNTALNDLRDRPPSARELAESLADGGGNPAEELERREELAKLIERLRALPEAQRAAIVMRELEGLSHEEIATALGLSGGGARQAIYRARRALRDGMGLLMPLPLLKALLSGSAAAPLEAAAGAGGAGAAGLGGAAGASVALKAATATVLVAGAVGAGVAIDHGRNQAGPPEAKAQRVTGAGSSRTASTGKSGASGQTGGSKRGGGGRGTGSAAGPDHGRRGSGAGEGNSDGGLGGGRESRHGGDGPSAPSGPTAHQGGEGEEGHRSGRSPEGSEGSGEGPSGGGQTGGERQQEEGDSGGEQPSSSGDGSGGESGSESNSGPGSGDGGGESGGESEESGDSHDGEVFSVQSEPQTQEER